MFSGDFFKGQIEQFWKFLELAVSELFFNKDCSKNTLKRKKEKKYFIDPLEFLFYRSTCAC